ncbi:hypothetical protein SOMG_01513 [Schizosaccharomyces osmophilus]|uniref:Uncharacterized protein n=1 Tax=Schizosaccharomyces osmophilus TaxID=2545709 RepID=A0AAE9W7W2_9SCHI|nr:uncharacterized protein SOMG_01513 [Schizosaccharomyces osmophilus]WBW70536.1 hypothetical protein SOMG_01513 [Schizosaccharomyces osmophilus]
MRQRSSDSATNTPYLSEGSTKNSTLYSRYSTLLNQEVGRERKYFQSDGYESSSAMVQSRSQ